MIGASFLAQEEGYSPLAKIFRSATGEQGLTAVRSRSRENNTQLFSNALAPLRYPCLLGKRFSRSDVKAIVVLGNLYLKRKLVDNTANYRSFAQIHMGKDQLFRSCLFYSV